jgi:acetate kinase
MRSTPVAEQEDLHVLTINTGSSSLKAALYDTGEREQLLLAAQIAEIGHPESRIRLSDAGGQAITDEQAPVPDYPSALHVFQAALERQNLAPGAVGHRVVHGGSAYSQPHRVTPELVSTLETLVPVAPDHLPQAIQAIRAIEKTYPALPQVACFDTAFHSSMPPIARRYALPRRLAEAGIVRYGFHGLSYEFIMSELAGAAPAEAAGRVLIAHLGNGASMAAVRAGASMETTMGFTPAGGLVMGTRVGDLDPGVLLYLMEKPGTTPATLSALVNKEAGLLGVSGTTADMRELLEREPTDPRAAEAIDLFCYQAKKYIGALASALGGLETLIFTGGIGEHAAPVRARICEGLGFLGIRLNRARNAASAPIISRSGSPVTVRVMKTDEDLMIARHTRRLLSGE